MASDSGSISTDIPARLDRLPWSAWHWKVVIALGVSWLLDGLEVTVVGSLGPALQRPETLGLTAGQIGWAASSYIGGAVLGTSPRSPSAASSPASASVGSTRRSIRRSMSSSRRACAGAWTWRSMGRSGSVQRWERD